MEQQDRQEIYRLMTMVPHRNITTAVQGFRASGLRDPDFTARLAAYLNDPVSGQKIRDIQEAGVVHLLQADARQFPDYREAGLATLLGEDVYPASKMPGLPPHRILRVLDYLRSPWELCVPQGDDGVVVTRYATAKRARRAQVRVLHRLQAKRARELESGDHAGLHVEDLMEDDMIIRREQAHNQVARLARRALGDWLGFLEGDQRRADGVVLFDRRVLGDIWTHYHLSSHDFPMMHSFLFGSPPADTRCARVREIAVMDDPVAQAKAIAQYNIPMTVATGLVHEWTMPVKIAVVSNLTPQQALNWAKIIEEWGLLENEQIRNLVEGRIAQATASRATTQHRRSAQTADAGIMQAKKKARKRAVAKARQAAPIERPLLVLCDRSGSMDQAIEVLRELIAHIAPLVVAPIWIVAFNTRGIVLDLPADLTDEDAVEQMLARIRATGGTSIGAGLRVGLQAAEHDGVWPQEVLIITDTGDNTRPFLVDVAQSIYQDHPLDMPHFTFLELPGEKRSVLADMRRVGFDIDVFNMGHATRDYAVFDQVAALISGPAGQTVIQQIMEYDLPVIA